MGERAHARLTTRLSESSGHRYGYTVDEAFYEKHVHGRTDKDVFSSLMPAGSTPEQLAAVSKQKDDLYCAKVRAGVEKFRILDGLADMLAFADRHHVKCICVSNAPRGGCEAVIAALHEQIPGAKEALLVEELVVGAECERAKPFPDPYLEGMRRLGVAPEDCIVFEDSRTGPSRAKSASRSLRRALLTPQANPGSLYRCGKRTQEQPVGHVWRERGPESAPKR